MNRFTGPQRAFCVPAFYKNNDYYIVRRLYKTHFNLTSLKYVPSANLIKHWVCKFEETGNTMSDKSSRRKRILRTSMNVDRVPQSVMDDTQQSLRFRAASLNLNKSTVHLNISKHLHFHPCKIRLGGNQRELARAKNQKKQMEQQKKKGACDKSSNAGLTLEQRKHRDAELMREKQRRKEEATAAKSSA